MKTMEVKLSTLQRELSWLKKEHDSCILNNDLMRAAQTKDEINCLKEKIKRLSA